MNEYDFDSEEAIDLSPEEQVAAAALGLGSTKRLSKKAYAEFKKKAEDIVAQSSVPSKTPRQAAKGIVKGGGQKSAKVSARAFEKALEKGPIKVPSGSVISDLPQVSGKMGAALDKAKRAAAGIPWQPAEGVINLPGPPSSRSSIMDILSKGGDSALSALKKIGVSPSALESAGKLASKAVKVGGPILSAASFLDSETAGEGSDVPKNPFTGDARQLSSAELSSLSPGTPVDYYPPAGRSEMNPVMASSKYDSLENIIADTARPPEEGDVRALAAKTQAEEAKQILSPKARTISAGEPTAAQVAKQTEDAALNKILSQKSEYEDLLARYKDAEERQRLAQLGVSLGQAGERIGSAIAMVKPGDQSFYEQQMKLAGGITDEFKEEETIRREAEKNDPKSETSVSMRNLLKEQGITVPENISAAFIEKQYPQFTNIINRREAAKQDSIRRAERAQDRQDRMLERLDFKKREEALRLAPKIQNKNYEIYTGLNAQKNLVDEALANPSPQRDITLYYSFVRALDPDSVVREGELKFVQTSRSIPNAVRGALQKALNGKPMLPEERVEIQKFMNQRLSLARRQWEDSAAPYIAQAEKAGISRDLIAPGTTALTAPTESKQKETIKLPQKQTGKAGKTIVSKDGKRYVINADETTATEL